MLFSFKKKDWKQLLQAEDENKMNDFLRKISRHRGAYKNAEDVKSAQLWCAVLELCKENAILQRRLKDFEDVFEGMFEKMKKRDEERKELARSLEKF